MHWFETTAPIRLKMLIVVASLTALTAVATVAGVLGGTVVGLGIGAAATVMSAVLGLRFRRSVCDPYVATVVRMEALAAGDVTAPIAFTDYRDCVGRMTKAMFTFRDTAVRQSQHAEEQQAVVRSLGEHLHALAEGDLTAQITAEFPDSYAEVKSNFNDALSELRTLIGAVGASAASIRTGSNEIAHASEDLARRTEGNAASLEETSASLVQVDGRLKATAVAAARTVERADQAIATVGGGRTAADQAVGAMDRVSESAKGIDNVIEGLDKIAFQTRVLAMNAAVEAGRAGEAGRGFAVVADLVSALAMRAEEEAKRARDQLTVTQSEIGTAVEAVRKVDGALADISGDVAQVHELLGTMAADNQAQSAAVTQIAAAVGTMDQSTQQNAAMVEETSAAARNLTAEVGSLTEQTARFRVDAPARGKQSASRIVTDMRRSANAAPAARSAPVHPSRALATAGEDWNTF